MSGRLDRRDLLVRGGLLAGATAVGAAGGYAAAQGLDEDSQAAQGTTPEDRDALFSLDPAYTNLTTFLLASHPRPVREAIERHREALDASTALYLHEAEPAFEDEARAAAAEYLGTGPELVALTDSTTMGLGLVYAGLRLEPGDEVLTTEHDFYSTHESLRLREERDGIRVRRVRLYPPEAPERASADAIVGALADSIAPATRAVALTWVHSSSGVKLPLREIAGAVAAANEGRDDAERVLLCVDGIHGFGAEDASPVELGADVFVSGCHKWIFGPRGTGLVWAAEHAWPRIAPTIPPFDGQTFVSWITGEAPAGDAAGSVPHAGRLPLVRAPVGAHGGVRRPRGRPRRPRRGRGAHSRPRRAPEGRARRHPGRLGQDAWGRLALVRARLRRDRDAPARRRGPAPRGASRARERHAVRDRVPALRPERREQRGGRGSRRRGRGRDRLSAGADSGPGYNSIRAGL